MAKPEQPKDIKPKTEGEAAAPKAKKPIDENMKVIVINLATTVLICVLFLSVTMFASKLLNSKLSQMTAGSEASAETSTEGEGSGEEAVQKGLFWI